MDRNQTRQQTIDNSLNRQLESSSRALASIADSERMGIATAEELAVQGEQLDNIERKTDTIQQSTKVSQRHINNIKSIFGGIKNWWTGEPKEETPSEAAADRQRSDRFTEAVNRRPPPEQPFASPSFGSQDPFATQQQNVAGSSLQSSQRQEYRNEADRRLNDNLDSMSAGMARLKELSLGLGDEIHAQNEQLDRVKAKVDKADVGVRNQNDQIKKILR